MRNGKRFRLQGLVSPEIWRELQEGILSESIRYANWRKRQANPRKRKNLTTQVKEEFDKELREIENN
jgi:hypothetical protein